MPDRVNLRQRREEAARRILAETPELNNPQLARRIAMATKNQCSESTARNIRVTLAAQDAQDAQDAPDAPDAQGALAGGTAATQRPALHVISSPPAPSSSSSPASSASPAAPSSRQEEEERRQN